MKRQNVQKGGIVKKLLVLDKTVMEELEPLIKEDGENVSYVVRKLLKKYLDSKKLV